MTSSNNEQQIKELKERIMLEKELEVYNSGLETVNKIHEEARELKRAIDHLVEGCDPYDSDYRMGT